MALKPSTAQTGASGETSESNVTDIGLGKPIRAGDARQDAAPASTLSAAIASTPQGVGAQGVGAQGVGAQRPGAQRREVQRGDARTATPMERPRPAPARVSPVANDDLPAVGGLIQALQQRPSRMPFIVAGAASVVWLGFGLLIAWSVFEKTFPDGAGLTDLFSTPSFIAVIATVAVPIALFWFLAVLVWRAQELRLMSSAMTEVAVRLAEPDKMAEQSVAALGQTVRRQVAAMNDAISRALGRAGELEALVHNEVTALERSYSENENRIRSLIQELSNEREALANNSERVSEALRGVGTSVTLEINAASDRASQSLTTATATLSETLAQRGNKLTAAVTAAGAKIDENLAERGNRINEQLAKHGAQAAEKVHQSGLEVSRAIQETSDRTAAAISAKGNTLVSSVISMSERVGREMPVLLERLGGEQARLSGIIEHAAQNLSELESALAQRTEALDTTLGERTRMLQGVLTDQTRSLDDTLIERTQALETLLGRRAQAIEGTVARHSGHIRESLENHSRGLEKGLARQTQLIEQAVTGTAKTVQAAMTDLAARSEASHQALSTQTQVLKDVSGGLLQQIHGLTKRFEDQGSAILNAARAMEQSNSKVDGVLEARQANLSRLLDGINTRAVELDRMMNGYSNMLEQSLAHAEVRARKVTEVLARDSADKSQTAVRELERLRAEAQNHTAKAITELKTNFASLSDQVTQQLSSMSSRFSETTREVRDHTNVAATELEATQNEMRARARAIPEATKQSATAMRRALQDQLSALDQLSGIAQRHGVGASVARPDAAYPRDDARGEFGRPPAHPQAGYGQPPAAPLTPPADEWPEPQPRNLDTVAERLVQRMGQPEQGDASYDQKERRPWSLGDLLARASEDDDTGYGRPQGFSPAPSSPPPARSADPAFGDPMFFDMKDMANAIDGDVANEIWQRYNRGERGVIGRAMYNASGQATFDQVKRRLEHDNTFKLITDHYLRDFEHVLKEASRSDPKGRAVQGHLVSESGRIYLLLAHASGRIG